MGDPPDKVLDPSDPGDDTQRRYRYQATQAAILSLSLFDDLAEVVEIFVEHHEDVLLKKINDMFLGVQIKSREDGSQPFKVGDDEIVKSVRRFISHEEKFPDAFEGYVLGSSVGFWAEKKNGSNLEYLLQLANAADPSKLPSALKNFLKKLYPTSKDNPKELSKDQIKQGLSVLKKMRLATLPAIRDIESALIAKLPNLSMIGDRLYSELASLARALVAQFVRAASLPLDSVRFSYVSIADDALNIETTETIDEKRFTKERFEKLIRCSLPAQPTLCTAGHFSTANLPEGIGRMKLKLAASGLTIENVQLASDLKASTELILTQWLQKDGRPTTDRRYQHMRTLVRNECQEAHDSTTRTDRPFGNDMLTEVRRRLRERHDSGSDLFGCGYEHLLGMAGMLTEECTLWWSEKFDIPEEGLRNESI